MARAFEPIVAPPKANEVPLAVPRTGVVSDGEFCIATTVPLPVRVYSPKTPALSYKILVVVPPVIVEEPTMSGAAGKSAVTSVLIVGRAKPPDVALANTKFAAVATWVTKSCALAVMYTSASPVRFIGLLELLELVTFRVSVPKKSSCS